MQASTDARSVIISVGFFLFRFFLFPLSRGHKFKELSSTAIYNLHKHVFLYLHFFRSNFVCFSVCPIGWIIYTKLIICPSDSHGALDKSIIEVILIIKKKVCYPHLAPVNPHCHLGSGEGACLSECRKVEVRGGCKFDAMRFLSPAAVWR